MKSVWADEFRQWDEFLAGLIDWEFRHPKYVDETNHVFGLLGEDGALYMYEPVATAIPGPITTWVMLIRDSEERVVDAFTFDEEGGFGY